MCSFQNCYDHEGFELCRWPSKAAAAADATDCIQADPPFAISNLGNTCYISSLAQVLAVSGIPWHKYAHSEHNGRLTLFLCAFMDLHCRRSSNLAISCLFFAECM
jgi:uncharacterized UBP type Zn finger protein